MRDYLYSQLHTLLNTMEPNVAAPLQQLIDQLQTEDNESPSVIRLSKPDLEPYAHTAAAKQRIAAMDHTDLAEIARQITKSEPLWDSYWIAVEHAVNGS